MKIQRPAEEVEPDSISGLREMIRSEHEALNFERYWMGIISEYEKRHEIDHYEATREQLLYDLSIIDDKIKMAKEELAEIFNTNNVQSQIDLTSSQNSENEIHTNSGTISDLGIKNLSISKAKKSITTLTQKDNTHNVLKLGIETSSTSQADKSITKTMILIMQEFQVPEKVKKKSIETSRTQDDASNNELGIGTSNTSQGEPRVQTLIQNDNNQSSIGTSSTSQRNNNYASNRLDTGRKQYCLRTQERVDYREGTPVRKHRRNSSANYKASFSFSFNDDIE
ncbi:hypothetical protein F8M41_002427 [Gigaspora margarita]|uniref:Uncharacterized protein n=1 Tax=Gigaspora margarita TaxID=4874 RepID=A0A8H3XEA5_GIGMA|nr:hypothetical protein F8M41_002427 [Gigaspora margarita]